MPRSCFLHIPKTGGTYVRRALQAAVPSAREYHINGNHHRGLRDVPFRCFTFAFVRNPLEWYRSYWRFKVERKWFDPNELDEDCADDTFAGFIEKMLVHHPGYFSKEIARVTQFTGCTVDFIGKQESLVDDLITALNKAGEEFDQDAIRSHPIENESNHHLSAEYTGEQIDAIRFNEHEIFSRWYKDAA